MALTQISTDGIKNGTITGTDLATNVDLVDNQKLRIGTGNDLLIYHDSNDSYIQDNGTGKLVLATNGTRIDFFDTANSATLAKFITGGAVELYHNNNKKFETTSAGVELTGSMSGLTTSGDVAFNSGTTNKNILFDASQISLEFDDGVRATFGYDRDLQIYHDGNHSYIDDAGTGNLYIQSNHVNIDSKNGEQFINCIQDGAVELYHDNSKKFETTSGGATVTGTCTATTFSGSGASLTSIPAGQLTGTIDADTLDSISSASFLRSDAADTASGDITFSGGSGAATIAADSDIRFANSSTWTGNTTAAKIQLYSNVLYIGIGPSGLIFRENGSNRWTLDGTGHFRPSVDSTYDLGSTTNQVRNGYFDTLYGDGSNLTNVRGTSVKNLVINGAMLVAQKATTSTQQLYSTVDRIRAARVNVDENPTFSQATLTLGTHTTTPYLEGHRKAFKITNGNQTSGAQSTDVIAFSTRIEAQDIATSGWNYTDTNSFITLQFWVKSSVAQNFYIRLFTQDGTQKNYPMETGTLTADVWTKITKTIPGHADLQFDNDTERGLDIDFSVFRGTNQTSSGVTLNQWANLDDTAKIPDMTSTWYTTNDAEFMVTGIQLEIGSTASPFVHESFNEVLHKCQRYCYVIKMQNGDFSGFVGQALNTADAHVLSNFPVPMRTEPTYTGSATLCRFQAGNSSSDVNLNALSIFRVPTQRPVATIGLRDQNVGSMTTGQALMLQARANNGKMTFEAEL
ncbi:MAG: hypothetical protein CML17_13045 [Pusillimonas sp.]|nr:hypothetical protein [Pusillimonas sp.]